MKFVQCKTKREFIEACGFDWVKIVKVEGGYIGFSTIDKYKTWKGQK